MGRALAPWPGCSRWSSPACCWQPAWWSLPVAAAITQGYLSGFCRARAGGAGVVVGVARGRAAAGIGDCARRGAASAYGAGAATLAGVTRMTSAVLSSGAAMDRRVAVPRHTGASRSVPIAAMAMLVLLVRWWPRGSPWREAMWRSRRPGPACSTTWSSAAPLVQPAFNRCCLTRAKTAASEQGAGEGRRTGRGRAVAGGAEQHAARAGADGALQRGGAAVGQLLDPARRVDAGPGGAATHADGRRVRAAARAPLHQRNRELAATGFFVALGAGGLGRPAEHGG